MKDIFQKEENWRPVFGEYGDNESPLYSIYRWKLSAKSNLQLSKIVPHPGEDVGLHILFLNADG